MKSRIFLRNIICQPRQLVLVITCLGGRFGINCPSAFLKILILLEQNEGNFKIFKNHEGDISQKLPEPNIWLLINHTPKQQTLCIEIDTF